jgi:hypothetical protein
MVGFPFFLSLPGGKSEELVSKVAGVAYGWTSSTIQEDRACVTFLCCLSSHVCGLSISGGFHWDLCSSHLKKKGEIVGEECDSEIQTTSEKANCFACYKAGGGISGSEETGICVREARTGSRGWDPGNCIIFWLQRTPSTLATCQSFLSYAFYKGKAQTFGGRSEELFRRSILKD